MDKKQIARFRAVARGEIADEADDALDRVFDRLNLRKKPEAEPHEEHLVERSDESD